MKIERIVQNADRLQESDLISLYGGDELMGNNNNAKKCKCAGTGDNNNNSKECTCGYNEPISHIEKPNNAGFVD